MLSELRAEREVILCAGAYNSPQILMLSGIGIASELQAYGIVPRVNLPVGENLQDHPIIGLFFLTDTETLIKASTVENVALLRNEGRGPLSSNIGEAGGFFRTCDGLAGPDFQLLAAPVMFVDEGLALPTQDAFGFAPVLLRPTSRGKVFLRSLLPSAKPHILHGYYATEEDRDAMIRAVRKLLEIAEQPALSEHRRDVLRMPASDSDADILDFVQRPPRAWLTSWERTSRVPWPRQHHPHRRDGPLTARPLLTSWPSPNMSPTRICVPG